MIRRLIVWLTWSKRRAVTALAAVVFVLTVLGVAQLVRTAAALNGVASRVSMAVPQVNPSASVPTPSGAVTLTGRDDVVALPATEQAQTRALATRFIQVWLAGPKAPSTTVWLAPLRGQIVSALRPFLDSSRNAIPAARVISTTHATATAGQASSTFRLSNGDRVLVELTNDGRRWLVSNYRPVS